MSRKKATKTSSPTDSLYYFDEAAADRVVEFFRKYLRHSKGQWAGQPFELAPWQVKILRDVFGWKRKSDGMRRYRKVFLEVPRKNGKSTLAAGVALYLLCADGERGADVFSCAGDTDQARQVFDEAKRMVAASPELSKRLTPYQREIQYNATASKYFVISAKADTKHGKNAHGIIFDELHVQKSRELWDTMESSRGSRTQPLTFAITTAGYDRASICYNEYDYAKKVKDGKVQDDTCYVAIFEADIEDDWTAHSTWAKANPNLGVSVSIEYLQGECQKAQDNPAYENTFRRLYLNQWTSQDVRWIPMHVWTACGGVVNADALLGRTCYGGLDLANTGDVAAFVLVFPEGDRYDVLPQFWIPADNIAQRVKDHRVPYDLWARQGYMTATDGNVIDYGVIENHIKAAAQKYALKQITIDMWNAAQIAQNLGYAGIDIVKMPQSTARMNAPAKELFRRVQGRLLNHGNHPVLTWMADNVSVEVDQSGNIRPSKKKSLEKIDGIVALVMAIDSEMRLGAVDKQPKPYESSGVFFL